MKEIWLPIKGFEQLYQISNFGRIKSLKRNIIRKPGLTGGYPDIKLCLNGRKIGKYIHRLIAEHFIPNPMNKPEVNHEDGNKTNNSLTNLKWSTQKENFLHAIKTGLNSCWKTSSVPVIQLSLDNQFIKEYISGAEAARQLNVHSHSIYCCLKGRRKTCKGFKWEYKSKFDSSE
jgi:hypothetical protein